MKELQDFIGEITDFSEEGRVWVFQADRVLSSAEQNIIQEGINNFLPTWQAHGKALQAKGRVLYDLFLVVAVNESVEAATGCSIDTLVRKVKAVGEELKLDFYNRFNTAFLEDGEVDFMLEEDVQSYIQRKELGKAFVFNNTIDTILKLKQNWLVCYKGSWQETYFTSSQAFSLKL